MLKSVLAAMPTYTMSCFKLPCSLYKRIQSALTRFWWDSSMDKKKMCWISWLNLTKSKGEGGLGFRDLQCFNDALLAKLSWRILTKPQCLLARTLLGKYCHFTPFLDCKPPATISHGWRSICIGRDLLKRKLGKVIGCGKQTSLWQEPWLSLQSPITPMGPPHASSHKWTVSQLISPTTLEWDRGLIQQTIPEFEIEILEIHLSKLGAEDSYAWLPAKNGAYSARSGYYESIRSIPLSPQHVSPVTDFKWTKEIWKINTSPKMKFFMWKAMRGSLPVGENLRLRQINEEARCPFCGEEESSFHLFFTCRTGPLLPWILWSIWLSRNHLIFKDRLSSPSETLARAISLAREWLLAQNTTQIRPLQQTPGKIISISNNTTICQTDAVWNKEHKLVGLGWIFNPTITETSRIGSNSRRNVRSPLLAEALAIHEALCHASTLGIQNNAIASDSKQLINAINLGDPPLELHEILHDILSLSSTFLQSSFSFISRKHNREADEIAKCSLKTIVPDPV
ncbi:putative ribonuclease H domain, reverse transcriptase zinc-binding domain-containing protein [Arabidopsis thaliana]